MGRKVITGALALLSIGVLVRLLVGPDALRAQSVDEASARLEQTEGRLATEVTKSAATAGKLATDLGSSDGQERLPAELADFVRSTDRLRQLQADLEQDITAYDAARQAKLAAFDGELKQINDQGTRRHMERLRARAYRHTTEQLQNAKASLEALQGVLHQGTDLQHAAKCVQLADELSLQGADLDNHVARAKENVAQYSRLTNNLLARLTTNNSTAD